MSEAATPGVEGVDHRKQAAYVAISDVRGTDRRLHRVDGDPEPGDLRNGEECEVACDTTLVSDESCWKAKPATVFPPGYRELCTDPDCFGRDDVDEEEADQ